MMIFSLLMACGPAEAPAEHGPPAAEAKASAPMADSVDVAAVRGRAMPPGTPNSGAFMTFRNSGATEARIVSAQADVSKTVELHTHVKEDGMMKMRQIPEIVLPAGEEVVLKPGGLHIMFIGLTQPFTEGRKFPLTLTFADGSTRQVEVPVEQIDVSHH